MEQEKKRYMNTEGTFYQSPEEEIRNHHKALESARDEYKRYEQGWKLMGEPGLLYLGLRLAGSFFDIGPEIDVMNLITLDYIAGVLTSIGGVSKLLSFLTSFDVKNSKKGLEKAVKRIGFRNSEVEKIVAENSQ